MTRPATAQTLPTQDLFLQQPGPPLAAQVAESRRQNTPLSAPEQQAILHQLKQGQKTLVTRLQAHNIPVVWQFQRALLGVQVQVTGAQREVLRTLPGVVAIHPVPTLYAQLDRSVRHIGALRAFAELGLDGTNVDIGIIDSGIDYLHPAFGGPGTLEAYEANDTLAVDDTWQDTPLFPTAKVVGGYDFVGDGYSPGQGPPTPDPDPMPDQTEDPEDGPPRFSEHGTHVAATAAGLAWTDGAAGVAPGARLWALKVIANGGTNMGAAAIDWALDPDGNGDISDALDVLNLSLGGSFSSGGSQGNDVYAEAIENFVAVGGVVVVSAGNTGNRPFAVSSPSVLPHTISIANTRGPGEWGVFARIDAPSSLSGMVAIREARKKLAVRLSETGNVAGNVVFVGHGCDGSNYPLHTPGAIVLMHRGECTYGEKFQLAVAAGAAAGLVIQYADKNPYRMDGSPKSPVPAAMIHHEDGQALIGALDAGDVVTLTLSAWHPYVSLTDTMNGSSSRGPAYPFRDAESNRVVAKPDLSAPGTNIGAAQAGPGGKTVSFSGTSMAAPHVAGAVALLRQAHPDWSARALKAALMNTAISGVYVGENEELGGNGSVAPFSLQGAGRLDIELAARTHVIAYSDPEVTVDFGLVRTAEPVTLERTVTVENKGTVEQTYAVDFAFRASTTDHAGVNIHLSTETITVPAGEISTLIVTATIDPAALPPWPLTPHGTAGGDPQGGNALSTVEHDGEIQLLPTEDHATAPPLHVPVYLLSQAPAQIEAQPTCVGPESTPLPLINQGPAAAQVSAFTLLGTDPEDADIHDSADLRAVAFRTGTAGKEDSLIIALNTWGERLHPGQLLTAIFLDVNGDVLADYLLFGRDNGLDYGTLSGAMRTRLFVAEDANGDQKFDFESPWGVYDAVGDFPVFGDVLSGNVAYSVPLAALALDPDNPTLNVWMAVFDLGAEDAFGQADVAPEGVSLDHLKFSQHFYRIELGCTEWSFESHEADFEEETSLLLTSLPACHPDGSNTAGPPGVLLWTNGSPGADEALLVDASELLPTYTCVEALTRPVPEEQCARDIAPEELLTTECPHSLALAPTPAGQALAPGLHTVHVAITDPWGSITTCSSQVTVEDPWPPSIACPPGSLTRGLGVMVSASDLCGQTTLSVLEHACTNEDQQAAECSVSTPDGSLRLSEASDDAAWLEITLAATDTAGNRAEIDCTLPIRAPERTPPPPAPTPIAGPSEESGCQALPQTTPSSSSAVFLLLLLTLAGLGVRRRTTP